MNGFVRNGAKIICISVIKPMGRIQKVSLLELLRIDIFIPKQRREKQFVLFFELSFLAFGMCR